jgi:acyl-coenzyme A thioesterase PaaI-like protein
MTDPAAPGHRLLRVWRTLQSAPGGRWLFAVLLGRMVPYTGSMRARVLELEPGRTTVALPDRRRVRNHLGSVHAVALVNVGELTTGLAVLTALPQGIRGIVTGLSAEYLHKARGPLTARADVRALGLGQLREQRDIEVAAEIRDVSDDVVARVTARWRLSPSSQP